MNFLNISNIDKFSDEFIVHVELEMLNKENVKFAKSIDEENYDPRCWLVMCAFDNKDKSYINSELYYISNGGLVVAKKQLSQKEIGKIISFIKSSKEFIEWK